MTIPFKYVLWLYVHNSLLVPRIFLIFLFLGMAWGQNDTGLEVITLKSGDVLRGQIVNASFTSVTLKKVDDGKTIEISRDDIDNISTPFSRGEVEASVKSTMSSSTHLYNAGNKLENYVIYTIIGTILNVSSLYFIAQASKDGESPSKGIILSLAGSAMSFFGTLQVGNAGEDLKRASSKMKSEKDD